LKRRVYDKLGLNMTPNKHDRIIKSKWHNSKQF